MAKSQEVLEQDARPAEMSAYQLLHLLPSAPQELIVEVYWHLVHQLQAAAGEDPLLRSRLDRLNEAYAAVVDPEARAEYEAYRARSAEPVNGAEAGSPTGVLRRLWKRQPARSSPQRSPWQLLHLDPNAPPDVAELAYSFWRLRLRSQWGDSAATELEKLQEAYQALRRREAESPSEPGSAESGAAAGADGVATEAVPGAATDAEPDADTVGLDEPGDAAEVGDPDEEKASHPRLPRVWRSAVAMSASFGRWAGGVASAGWERLPTLLDNRAADSLHGLPADAAGPAGEAANAPWDLAEQAPQLSVEDRLAALTDSSAEHTATPHIEPEMSKDGAREAPVDEGRTDEESAQPLTEPKVTAPLRSETILQVQPSQVAQLVAESGSARGSGTAIGRGPFSIGTGPTCDLVVTANDTGRNSVLARIWSQEDRFMFHSIGKMPAVLVNGQALAWAVLEDGDRLHIGDDVFRFERIPRSGMDTNLDGHLTGQSGRDGRVP